MSKCEASRQRSMTERQLLKMETEKIKQEALTNRELMRQGLYFEEGELPPTEPLPITAREPLHRRSNDILDDIGASSGFDSSCDLGL